MGTDPPPEGNPAEESRFIYFLLVDTGGSKRRDGVKTKGRRGARWRPMEVTEAELEAQRSTKAKSGFKGVKVTSSRKYQPQIWCPELGTMRALGSYETAEEAAVVLIEAKREGACWEGPMDYR